jgi:hypothetical protein
VPAGGLLVVIGRRHCLSCLVSFTHNVCWLSRSVTISSKVTPT